MNERRPRGKPPGKDAGRKPFAPPEAREERFRHAPPVAVHQDASHRPRIVLQPGREKSLARRHPWIFSGAVARVEGILEAGTTVEVISAEGGFLAWAAYSPDSQILARVWSFEAHAKIGEEFLVAAVRRAIARRGPAAGRAGHDAVRLIHAEADGLPGVVADRFGDWISLQLGSAGAWRWREAIAAALEAETGIGNIHERSDMDVLALEGLPTRVGPVRGGEPPDAVVFEEVGLRFETALRGGQKTGFYLDQRDNRALLRGLSAGQDVLDCFSYTGGFALNALAGGAASVTLVERSAEALEGARHHVTLNGLPQDRVQYLEADVFAMLRKFRDQGRQFGVVVLDPPKFAPTAAMAERAARGYKDINLWALKLLRPGGLLLTFSCSGGVSRDLFQKIVAGAAVDAGADAEILRHLGAAADHPVNLTFPEGDYLKGLLCKVV